MCCTDAEVFKFLPLPCRYTENQFDAEFIGVLQEACYKFIVRNADCTLSEVAEFIQSRGFSKVDLRQEDVQMILNTLQVGGTAIKVCLLKPTLCCTTPDSKKRLWTL